MTLAFVRAALARREGPCVALVLRYGSINAREARPRVWSIARAILADLCGCAIEALAIVRGAHGKPALATARGVSFNISHAAGASLLAFSATGEVGCDIEDRLEPDDFERIGPLVLHPNEMRYLHARPGREERIHAFARCWVRKEAALKARGWGFALEARGVDTGLETAQAAIRFDTGPVLVIHDAPASIGFAAAVACVDAECAWRAEDLASAAAS